MKKSRFASTAALLCVMLGASVMLSSCRFPSVPVSGNLPAPDTSLISSGTTTSDVSSESSSGLPDFVSPDSSEPSSTPVSSQTPPVSSDPSSQPASSAPVSSKPAETFTFNMYDITIRKAGGSYRVYNGSVPVSDIQWTSKNTSIAVIKNGVVTAVSSGTTWVYAEYNGTKLSCIVRCIIPAPSSSKPPVSSAPSGPAVQPGISSGTLEELRNTHIYKAMKKLNSKADFTNPEAYGETAYSKDWYSADGFEETAAGLPDYAEMKKQGICCAGLVNYYLFNYLPNVAGIDPGLTWKSHPNNSNTDIHTSQIRANSTSYTMNNSSWTKTYSTPLATGKDYSYVAKDYAAGKLKYRVGDILTFSSSSSNYYHVAVYAGYYDGQHWIVHATDTPKGVGVTLTPFNGYSLPRKGFTIYVTEIFTP